MANIRFGDLREVKIERIRENLREGWSALTDGTNATHDRGKRRDIENRKIDCGRARFDALGIEYEVATTHQKVLTPEVK